MDLAITIYLIDVLNAVFNGNLQVLSYLTLTAMGGLGTLYLVFGGKQSALAAKHKRELGHHIPEGEGFASFFYMLPKKYILSVTIPLIVGNLLVPSKDTMYTMLAAYGVQTAAENENVQQFAGKSLEVLEKAMDEYLEDGEY